MSTAQEFRSTEHKKMQDVPIVVGKEIHLSANPVIRNDMCRKLAGIYPKDFYWAGWCENCRCFTTWLLATDDEKMQWIKTGELANSILTVEDVPENFKQWCREHRDIVESDNAPDFITMNRKYLYFL